MNARQILSTLIFSSLFTLCACDKEEDPGTNTADACASMCTVTLSCEGDGSDYTQAECQMECESDMASIESLSASCASAFEALNLCLGSLTCEEYDDYWNEPTPDYPCADEDDQVDAVCDV